MKTHRIEKIIYNTSKLLLLVWVLAFISHIIFSDRFVVLSYITNFAYGLGGLSPLIMLFINYRRSKRGYKFPLSIAAMKNSKAELPKKIYKFCSLTKTYADDLKEPPEGEKWKPLVFDLDESKLKTLKCNQIWMSDFSSLNDPYEGQLCYIPNNRSDDPEIDMIERFFLLGERDKYIQSSFSYDYHNILMWGHYANALKGYCVEYEITDCTNLFPVTYTRKRLLVSSARYNKEVVRNILQLNFNSNKLTPSEADNYFLYLQSFKSDIWSYEKEVRVVDFRERLEGQKDNNVSCDIYGLKISRIIIGQKCYYADRLIEIAKKYKVPFSFMKMTFDSNEYKLIEETFDAISDEQST